MIVEFRPDTSDEDVDVVQRMVTDWGAQCRRVRWRDRTVLVVTEFDTERWGARFAQRCDRLPSVIRLVRPSGPNLLSSCEFQPAGTVVDVTGVPIGDGNFVVAAGPCAVECADLLSATADAVAGAGAALLRGGAYKPRTSPYSFAGVGDHGLDLLAQQRGRTGLRVVTEVLDPAKVDLVAAHADMLQIGTRNMQNHALLREVSLAGLPVLLKRGMGATVEEWLLAAEYILSYGNPDVVLCERGIRTFETSTRFTVDLTAVTVVKRTSGLPVFVDPSHAAGHAYAVPALALAAAAVGADGVLVDVHAEPTRARCDAGQALTPTEFGALMNALERQLRAAGRALTVLPSADERDGRLAGQQKDAPVAAGPGR